MFTDAEIQIMLDESRKQMAELLEIDTDALPVFEHTEQYTIIRQHFDCSPDL